MMLRMPYEFVEYESRAFAGRSWFRPGEGMFEEVERVAEIHARVRGVEIDILEGAVMPSGRIASVERIGLRVRP